jgi:hypothetical protein
LQRVMIVDWDIHHGNGTQELFYDSNQVLHPPLKKTPLLCTNHCSCLGTHPVNSSSNVFGSQNCWRRAAFFPRER